MGIAGYSFVLTLRRGPLRSVEPRPAALAAATSSAPERLVPDPELRQRALPASVAMNPRETSRIAIAMRNLPPTLDRSVAGIALCAAETGAEFTWTPLAELGADGVLSATTPIVGSVAITLARSRAQARHGYLQRAVHTFPLSRGPVEPVPFDCATDTVQLVLADPQHAAGPLCLRRSGDPQWTASDAAPTGLLLRGKATVEVVLGSGDYELVDAVDPTRRQPFTVPTRGPLAVTAAVSRPASDRP